MPWEVTIVNSTDRSKPLGRRDDVISKFAAALPGALFESERGPTPDMIAQMPPVLQEHYAQRKRQLNASFEGENFSIEFYTPDTPEIASVGAEVRGSGNPLTALSLLCIPNNWQAINSSDNSVLNLTSARSAEWEAFCAWRDKTVQVLRSKETPSR